MTNEERKDFYMNRNIKLLPMYYAFTWDVFFVFTISTLFYINQKHLNYSQVILLESLRMLFVALMCIPVSKIFSKVSALFSSRLATLGYAGFLLISIFGKSFGVFVVGEIFIAFAYSVKSVKDNTILLDSLHLVKRDKEYQRVFGGGISIYYIVEAIGAVVISYVYNWQPYAAYYISLVVVGLVLLYSFLIKNPDKFQPSNINLNPMQENKKDKTAAENVETDLIKRKKHAKNKQNSQKADSYLKILSVSMFACMLLYLFFFRGVIGMDTAAFKTYLTMLTDNKIIPVWAFGYIFAGVRLCTCLSTRYQFKFNIKFGVRSLVIFNVLLIATFVINGVVYLINPFSIASIVIITISSYIMCSLRMPNQIFCNNYMQVCLKPKNIEKAYAIRTTVEYAGYAIMSFIFSQILSHTNNNLGLTNLIYIGIFALPILLGLILFLNKLIKKYTEKFTIIKDEYVDD